MADFKAFLIKLNKNLNILKERKAKRAGNAPLELLNQIDDHQTAIDLTEQAITGELSQTEWQESLRPLLVSVDPRRAAQNIIIILEQYAPDKGAALGQTVGPQALDTAGEIFVAALNYLRQKDAASQVVANEFEKSPAVYEKPVEQKLAESLRTDPDFAARLKTMLARYGQAAKEHAVATGSAYQTMITNSTAAIGADAAAASKGSAAVSGNVEGGIHISHSDKDDQ